MRNTIFGLAFMGLFIGANGVCGAIENGTNLVIPLVMMIVSAGIVLMEGFRENEKNIHDCASNHNGADSRPYFLH